MKRPNINDYGDVAENDYGRVIVWHNCSSGPDYQKALEKYIEYLENNHKYIKAPEDNTCYICGGKKH